VVVAAMRFVSLFFILCKLPLLENYRQLRVCFAKSRE
jgi:hypothetical protein